MDTIKVNKAILEPSRYSHIGKIMLPFFYQKLNPNEHIPCVIEWILSLGVHIDDIYQTIQMLWEHTEYSVYLIGNYNGERTSMELSIFEHEIRVAVKISDAEIKPSQYCK